MLTIDVDCGSGDGLSCEASNGRLCRFASTTSVLMDSVTGPDRTVFRCHLFCDEHGYPGRLRELPGVRVMRCRQCLEAEARTTEESNP